jgi:glycosyltransferase involved in cell wall biosynthesis
MASQRPEPEASGRSLVPIKRVLHVITDLGQGGAEAVLYRLIAATRESFEHEVVSLHGEGVYATPLRAIGTRVTALGMRRGRVSLKGIRALRRIVSKSRPHVVQTRLDHANLLGGLAARYAGSPPVVWAVHSTDLGPLRNSWKTRLVRRLCARLSHSLPAAIVSDAQSGAALHQKLGFSAAKLIVIPNGVDPTMFHSDPDARERIRGQWKVGREETLLGCVARWDPLKDHENLLAAIKHLSDRGRRFRCALVGRGMDLQNAELVRLAERWGVTGRLILAGPSADVPAVMNALDVHVLPSRAESLPVAVMEAMACGTPCVVTDVGDARRIVGELGWAAPPRNPVALADALDLALGASRGEATGKRNAECRARVIREFSLTRMAADYASVWLKATVGERAV